MATQQVYRRRAVLAILGLVGLYAISRRSATNGRRKLKALRTDYKRRPLFVGANWKCGLEKTSEVDTLIGSLNKVWPSMASALHDIEIAILPPYVFIDGVRMQLTDDIEVGGQNICDSLEGFKHTGSVTADMLQDLGCRWVLLGHSDRRNVQMETDTLLAQKLNMCLASGLNVLLTIGETPDVRAKGAAAAIEVLLKQLGTATATVSKADWGRIVVAYEPVWAIGEGATPCSPDEAQRVHAALRAFVREKAGVEAASVVRIVYTGSVNEKNAESYANLPDVDGFVLGRAGMDVGKLIDICSTLARCKAIAK